MIAKDRDNPEIEATFITGVLLGPFGLIEKCQIGFTYDENDVAFRPRVPEEPGRFYKLLCKLRLKKEELHHDQNFPLRRRKYGAKVYPVRFKKTHHGVEVSVTDGRLEQVAREFRLSIVKQ